MGPWSQCSYDPNGYPIVSYKWTIVDQPQGSSATLGAGIADRYGFRPDMAGDYTMQLVVENDRCLLSEPCTVDIQAIPNENLWVEMHWEHAGDDMDSIEDTTWNPMQSKFGLWSAPTPQYLIGSAFG